jgi:acyl dehydratase
VTSSLALTLSSKAIAEARTQIGREIPVWAWNTVASQDAIRHFAFGVGDDNPLWWDRTYAERSAVGALTAPPTFLYTLMSGGPWPSGDAGSVPEILAGSVGLWAEDRWSWYARVPADCELRAKATLWSLEEKTAASGEMMIAQTERYEISVDGGPMIAELFRTIMRLEPRGAGERSTSPPIHTYSADELAAIGRQYAAERELRRGAAPLFVEDVEVGDPIGPLVKGPLTIGGIAAFMSGLGPPMLPTNRIAHHYMESSPQVGLQHCDTGASEPTGAIHLDAELALRAGFDRGYDLGSQRISWMSHAICDWMGDDARLASLVVRIRRPNLVGDVTWISGTVLSKQMIETGGLVGCQLTGTNQRGEQTTTATATVELRSRES